MLTVCVVTPGFTYAPTRQPHTSVTASPSTSLAGVTSSHVTSLSKSAFAGVIFSTGMLGGASPITTCAVAPGLSPVPSLATAVTIHVSPRLCVPAVSSPFAPPGCTVVSPALCQSKRTCSLSGARSMSVGGLVSTGTRSSSVVGFSGLMLTDGAVGGVLISSPRSRPACAPLPSVTSTWSDCGPAGRSALSNAERPAASSGPVASTFLSAVVHVAVSRS